MTDIKGFTVNILDGSAGFVFGVGQHEQVLVVCCTLLFHAVGQVVHAEIGRAGLRPGKLYSDGLPSVYGECIGDDEVHGIFGFDPGTSAAGPSGASNQRKR